jgi:hypothetical protein
VKTGVLGLAVVTGIAALGPAGAVPNTADTGTDAAGASHQRPVPGRVVRTADIPEDNWLPGHRGVDLAAAPGDVVVSSAAGTVHFAGVVAGTPVVSVTHQDGVRTTYEPVVASVTAGDRVDRGQRIGVLADAAALPETARRGRGLSWGARTGEDFERYIDPMGLLGVVRVRLWS